MQPPKKESMIMETYEALGFEQKFLIFLCLLSYAVSMAIQVNDPGAVIKRQDWIIGFLASFIGGSMAYFSAAFMTQNIGAQMFFTVVASTISYRFFKAFNSKAFQDSLIASLLNGLAGFAAKFFAGRNNNNNNNNNNIDQNEESGNYQ
jgi:hypothetical protein